MLSVPARFLWAGIQFLYLRWYVCFFSGLGLTYCLCADFFWRVWLNFLIVNYNLFVFQQIDFQQFPIGFAEVFIQFLRFSALFNWVYWNFYWICWIFSHFQLYMSKFQQVPTDFVEISIELDFQQISITYAEFQ